MHMSFSFSQIYCFSLYLFSVFRVRDDAAMITALNCAALGQPSRVVGSDNSGLGRVGFKFCSFCAPIGSAGWPFKHKMSPLVGKHSLLCTWDSCRDCALPIKIWSLPCCVAAWWEYDQKDSQEGDRELHLLVQVCEEETQFEVRSHLRTLYHMDFLCRKMWQCF